MGNKAYAVLVFDDDGAYAEMLCTYLQIAGSFTVDLVDTLPQFWKHLADQPYDILFLDYKLQDTTGLDVLSELSKNNIRIPAVMMSGEGDERIATQAIKSGAVDYLVKGDDYLPGLPALIEKAVQVNTLKLSFEKSLDQIRYQATLLNNMRDAVVVWDMDGKITYWNPAAHILFGRSAEEQIGQPVQTAYLDSFQQKVRIPRPDETGGFEVEREYRSLGGADHLDQLPPDNASQR